MVVRFRPGHPPTRARGLSTGDESSETPARALVPCRCFFPVYRAASAARRISAGSDEAIGDTVAVPAEAVIARPPGSVSSLIRAQTAADTSTAAVSGYAGSKSAN